MALPPDINEREHGKFRDTNTGVVVAVTTVDSSLPIDGNNPSTELGYNAEGQLIRIRKTIAGTTYTQTITGDSIIDTVVATTKTISAYAQE